MLNRDISDDGNESEMGKLYLGVADPQTADENSKLTKKN